jgi:16S rRNA (guanine966-N2)-methyltransferase
LRVIAGELKGRQLKAPKWEGLRPTSDRLRETLFDILGAAVRGARVLDGYAGTGANGIEALSRGAAHVTFVDNDARAVRLIEENAARLLPDARERYAIIRAGVADAMRRAPAPFDLMILDPPYAPDAVADALEAAAAGAGPRTRLIIEHARRHSAPAQHEGWTLDRTVTAGDSVLSFYSTPPDE